jgi:FkbM family methyltransferase
MGQEMDRYAGYAEADLAWLDQFQQKDATAERGFVVDFLGVRHRLSALWPEARQLDAQVLGKPVPSDFHAETVEWIGMLKSVAAARDRWVVMELGAGYGTWVVGSGVAARRRGIEAFKLYGVEADPQHCASMRQHLIDNGFDPEAHRVIQAAVGAEAGQARWPKIADSSLNVGWSLRPMQRGEGDYMGRAFEETIDVTVLALGDLVGLEPVWDLIHIDVQGQEVALVNSCLDLLNERARWMIVGTHSRKIDGDLIEILTRAGWALEHEKPTRFTFQQGAPSLEAMTRHDGTQVWHNPRLA